MKKTFVLFIVIILPLAIFIFLKLFGTNQYEVPVLYTQGVDTIFSECNFPIKPHKVELMPDAIAPENNLVESDGMEFAVFYLTQDKENEISIQIINDLRRIAARYHNWGSLYLSVLFRQDGPAGLGSKDLLQRNLFFNHYPVSELRTFARCQLVIDFDTLSVAVNPYLVLVDGAGHIRGTYLATELDEIDRLSLELNILSKNE